MVMPLMRASLAAAAMLGLLSFTVPVQAAGGTVTVAVGADVFTTDPHKISGGGEYLFHTQVFEGLYGHDLTGKLEPLLATGHTVSADGLTYTFTLRPNVKFHDGSPFTADDVIFTFERAPAVPNSPSSFGLYIKGKTFEKVDDLTVRITTAEPYPLMPEDLSTVYVISKKAAEGATTADFNSGKAAIGTGPYKFMEYVPKERITVTANKDYWGTKPAWDKVTFRPITSPPSRVAAILAGDVDLIEEVPTVDIERLKTDKKLTITSGVSNRVIYLAMDQFRDVTPFATGAAEGKNPLRDLKVRKAMSKAINRDAIVSRIMEGAALPAGQLLADGFFGISPNLKPEKYDPDGAKKLLAEAGYPKGFGLTLHSPNNRYINDAKISEAVAAMLTRVGIQTKLETLPWNVFASRATSGGPDKTPEFSFILGGWGSGTGETAGSLKSLLQTWDPKTGGGAANRGRYSNPEMDKVLKEALATIDNTKRAALLAKANELALNDVGIIPLHYQVNFWAAKAGLRYAPRADERTLAMNVVAVKK